MLHTHTHTHIHTHTHTCAHACTHTKIVLCIDTARYLHSSFSGSGDDGGDTNSSRVSLPILPIAVALSTPAYYGVAGMFYFLGLTHLLFSLWMITEHYMLMKPFIKGELNATA